VSQLEKLITSASNPIVKRMRSLSSRKNRQQQQVSVVFGIQPVSQAIDAGMSIEHIVYCPEQIRRTAVLDMIEEQRDNGVSVIRLTPELFTRIADRDGPAGLAAIVGTRYLALDDLETTSDTTLVVLSRVANPGNLGTIFRSADATGAAGIVLLGNTADPFDPQAIKASMGAVFNIPAIRVADVDEFAAWARDRGITIATTSAKADETLWSAPLPSPLAILMGNEGEGLSDAELAKGSIQLSIPMVGMAESLNLAIATSILLYEVWRRRETA